MLEISGRKVTVVGLARSGVAAANLLSERGAEVTVTDTRTEKELGGQIKLLASQVRLSLGGHPEGIFLNADLIVLSPGVNLKNISHISRAQKAGTKVIGELELSYQLSTAPFIAVTGTNGKTTTTALIGELLKAWGLKVAVGGNIGFPLSQEVVKGGEKDYFVAEVSSFQLETIEEFRPRIALLLNITPDHLDRYDCFEDYVAAKVRLFDNQTAEDFAVLNADDPLVMEVTKDIKAQKVLFSRQRELSEGVFAQGGRIMAKLGGTTQDICSIGGLGLPGTHNLENALAATSAAVISGMPSHLIKKVLTNFQPLEHRLELVGQINGIRFVNDSKGTNVGAVIKSLTSFEEPIVLIAGGKDKGEDYSLLLDLIKKRVRKVVLIGAAKPIFKQAWQSVDEKLHEAGSMQEAVNLAFTLAREGDVVLLSPACASFDMFKNYEERGVAFKTAVNELEKQNITETNQSRLGL